MTYPLGWSVIPQTVIQRERWPGGYQGRYTPVVLPGQEVLPDQPVLRLEQPDEAESANGAFSPRLSLPVSLPGITAKMSLQAIRDRINAGGAEFFPAGLHGLVIEISPRGGVVIETRAALLQGTIGAGGQVAGVLTMWKSSGVGQVPGSRPIIPPGAILIVPGPLPFALLQQALNSGVVGIIASSMTLRDLEGFLRTDLLQLIGSDDVERPLRHLPPMTLLLTEGLGTLTMPARIMNLLSQYQGSVALLSGITAPNKGIVPELVISLPASEAAQSIEQWPHDPVPAIGSQVRIVSGEHEGTIGVIDYIFSYQQLFASGVRARALRLRCEDGSHLVVPITLVERIA